MQRMYRAQFVVAAGQERGLQVLRQIDTISKLRCRSGARASRAELPDMTTKAQTPEPKHPTPTLKPGVDCPCFPDLCDSLTNVTRFDHEPSGCVGRRCAGDRDKGQRCGPHLGEFFPLGNQTARTYTRTKRFPG